MKSLVNSSVHIDKMQQDPCSKIVTLQNYVNALEMHNKIHSTRFFNQSKFLIPSDVPANKL